MMVLPIIERELRTSSRQAGTYHLRLLVGGALLLATFVFAVRNGFTPDLGGQLFGDLHLSLFCVMWILVPFLTADCISRERREGTLGMLFLTQLTAHDIVVAKGLAQGLRGLTALLVVLPLLTVPFLLGGLSWQEATLSGLVNLSAFCLALASGLIASSLSRRWTRVVLYGICLSLLNCLIFCFVNAVLLIWAMRGWRAGVVARLSSSFVDGLTMLVGQGVWLAADWEGSWRMLLSRMGTAAKSQWLLGECGVASVCVLGLLLAIRFAAWRVRRVWHEEPPGARILWLEDKFCKPVFFRRIFRTWMRLKLERNPIGWLEQRSWNGRLVTWGWLGVVMCVYCAFLTGLQVFDTPHQLNLTVIWLLGGSLALSAAGSFRRERETGVLELLLVSPLREREIVGGRLRGLWGQFLPSIILAFAIWVYLGNLFPYYSFTGGWISQNASNSSDSAVVLFYASAFASLPVVGLYFSLRCRNFITAFLATLTAGMIAPPVVCSLSAALWLRWVWSHWRLGAGLYSWEPNIPFGWAAVLQVMIALICWRALNRRLKERNFPQTVIK